MAPTWAVPGLFTVSVSYLFHLFRNHLSSTLSFATRDKLQRQRNFNLSFDTYPTPSPSPPPVTSSHITSSHITSSHITSPSNHHTLSPIPSIGHDASFSFSEKTIDLVEHETAASNNFESPPSLF